MSNDTIGRFLLRLGELKDGDDTDVDMYKIGEDIGLVDGLQTEHIVEILRKDGYITILKENSKIRLTDAGYKRLDGKKEKLKTN